MARKRPGQKIEDIAEAAIACFIETGYRRTQMSDVARRLGIAAGTLYLYVTSKEALLHLAALQIAEQLPKPDEVPVSFSSMAETAAVLSTAIGEGAHWPVLKAAVTGGAKPDEKLCREIGDEIYDLLTRARRLVWLLDGCARDIPEMEKIRSDAMRGRYLADLLTLLRRGADPADWPDERIFIAARGAIELMAWSAMHRHRDPSPLPRLPEEDIRRIAAGAFAAALLSTQRP